MKAPKLKGVRQALPTNVITGFLGVGKTSAIQHLLERKPTNERWVVLINEFGKVGIDRQILGATTAQNSVEIREIVGGCMCCTSGLPMQVALNQLLRAHQLDRLLIEPSGLGHPEEVIASLAGPRYQGLLDIRATLTMVDARHFKEARYTEHPVFLQQLHIADVLVVNKTDLCGPDDIQQMEKTLQALALDKLPVRYCEQARIERDWMTVPSKSTRPKWHEPPGVFHTESAEIPLPESGFLREVQQLEGWYSCGWRFDKRWQFDETRLLEWSRTQDADRLKAVINLCDSTLIINQVEGQLNYRHSAETGEDESRLEMLFRRSPDVAAIEAAILGLALTD